MAEAFGAAASAIGVASFALQILNNVRDIHSFLASLVEAPDEIQRLVDKLALLGGVLKDVKNIADMQEAQAGTPALSSTIFATLKACEKDLAPLTVIIRKASIGYQSSRKIVRKWTSFKFVYKEKDIKLLEERLLSSMHLLTLSMIANMSHVSLSTHGSINILLTNSSGAQLNSVRSPYQSLDNSTSQLGPRLKSRSSCQHLFQYGGLEFTSSTRELVFSDVQSKNESQKRLGRRKSFSISARLLQYRLRIQVNTGTGWQHSFTIYRYLPEGDQVFDMVKKGNIRGLQLLFSEGGYSPFIRDEMIGGTLIHRAVVFEEAETLMFLINIGVDPTLGTFNNFLPLNYACSIEICKLLVQHGQNDPMIVTKLRSIHLKSDGALWLLNNEHFDVEIQILGDLIIKGFVINFWSHANRGFFEYLTFQADEIGTFLDQLFWVKNQFESAIIGSKWLELLALSKVDVEEYINEEKHHHSDNFLICNEDPFVRRKLVWNASNPTQYVSWEWLVLPESPACLVLMEFKFLALDYDYDKYHYNDYSRQKFWKEVWPFNINADEYGYMRYYKDEYGEMRYCIEEYEKIEKTRQTRYARQAERREQRRNYYKVPREYQPRRRGHRMPGSWTEEKYALLNESSYFSFQIPRWMVMFLLGLASHFLFHYYLMNINRNVLNPDDLTTNMYHL